jgi:hypothetical protein
MWARRRYIAQPIRHTSFISNMRLVLEGQRQALASPRSIFHLSDLGFTKLPRLTKEILKWCVFVSPVSWSNFDLPQWSGFMNSSMNSLASFQIHSTHAHRNHISRLKFPSSSIKEHIPRSRLASCKHERATSQAVGKCKAPLLILSVFPYICNKTMIRNAKAQIPA